MKKQFVFLSGLPRTGSTLLSAILSQNPKIYSEGNSAVCQLMYDMQQSCIHKAKEQLIANQINLSGTYKTEKIKHQLFTGLDFDNSIADAYTYVFNPFFYDTINIFNLNLYPQKKWLPLLVETAE